jgi:hypothetical protein
MRNVALVALVMTAGTSHLAAAASLDADVVVRIYNYAGVRQDQLAISQATADRIFQNAGISLRWMKCRVRSSDNASACVDALDEGREFMLRLIDGSEKISRQLALGTSMVDRGTRGGVLMTVSPRLVRAVAAGSAIEAATILGRAVAHELGHLLLGRVAHSRSGVMRAFWSQDELRGIRPADWWFSSSEAAQMRQGLSSRIRATN